MTDPSRVDPEFERVLQTHQAVVRAGTRAVTSRVILALLVAFLVPMLGSMAMVSSEAWGWLWLLPVLFVLGFWGAWRLHYRLLKPWYRKALMNGADAALLHELGVEAKLLHPSQSFFGRREAPFLEKIQQEVQLLKSGSVHDQAPTTMRDE